MGFSSKNKIKYYKTSGRIDHGTPFKAMISILPNILIFAPIYAVFIRYNPFIYFSFLGTVFLGLLVATTSSLISQNAGSRSYGFDSLVGLINGLIAVLASWFFWIVFFTEKTWLEVCDLLISGPAAWQQYLLWKSQNYHLRIGKYFNPSSEMNADQMLWLWGIEAFIIIFIATVGPLVANSGAYSEKSKEWAVLDQKLVFGWEKSLKEFEEAFAALGPELLLGLKKISDPGANELHLELSSVPSDQDLRLIHIEFLSSPAEAGKKPIRKSLQRNILVTDVIYTKLKEMYGRSC